MNGEVKLALAELRIAQSQVAREVGTPALDCLQEFVVNVGSPALGFGRLSVFVEGAFEDGVAGKDSGDFIPALDILAVGDVKNARQGGVVPVVGFKAAVIDRELLEVAQDAEWQLGGPGVAPELEGWRDIVLDIDRWALGFQEKLARSSYAEAVVRRLGRFADFDRVLMNHILVLFRVALAIIDVPTERLEKRIEKLPP